ncbi:MAG: hypothetical protein RML36_03405 [Anaerolineae bacterium]|nr:hypothetical protein [Anaerolineae bacterium]
MLSILSRQPLDLLPFEEVRTRLRLRNKFYRGLQEVPLDRIVGSLGRYRDFTRTFLPLHDGIQERWARVDELTHSGIGFPPVELYKVGEIYFVKDGNHRISVALAHRASTIQAHVWEYQTRVSLAPDTNVNDLVIKQEYLDFLTHTQLDLLRPAQRIECTIPGAYRELEEHIEVHRYFLGLERKAEVPYQEAVLSWYDNIYWPAVQAIRRHKVLDAFPGRTEADLYLWVMQHLYFLREAYGPTVDVESAALDLAERYPQAPMRRVVRTFYRYLPWLIKLKTLIAKRHQNADRMMQRASSGRRRSLTERSSAVNKLLTFLRGSLKWLVI